MVQTEKQRDGQQVEHVAYQSEPQWKKHKGEDAIWAAEL